MNDMVRWSSCDPARAEGLTRSGKVSPLRSGMAGALGSLVMVIALAAGAAVAVVFAATLAVIMALATILLALTALAWRVRPGAQRAVVRARRGHAWIAYGWERSGG